MLERDSVETVPLRHASKRPVDSAANAGHVDVEPRLGEAVLLRGVGDREQARDGVLVAEIEALMRHVLRPTIGLELAHPLDPKCAHERHVHPEGLEKSG